MSLYPRSQRLNHVAFYGLIFSLVVGNSACRPREASRLSSDASGGSLSTPKDTYHEGGRHGTNADQHWGYEASNDSELPPQRWHEHYEHCGSAMRQSPIDIPSTATAVTQARPALEFHWPTSASAFSVFNNRHTVQASTINGTTAEHRTRFDDRDFVLRQFHYHKRSEHTVDGKNYPVEVHFVHESVDNKSNYLVVGVFAEIKPGSSTFSQQLTQLAGRLRPRHDADRYVAETLFIETANMLPQFNRGMDERNYRGRFAAYNGSLTTPPCTEAVKWVVLLDPVTIGSRDIEQIQALKFDYERGNARPTQVGNAHQLRIF